MRHRRQPGFLEASQPLIARLTISNRILLFGLIKRMNLASITRTCLSVAVLVPVLLLSFVSRLRSEEPMAKLRVHSNQHLLADEMGSPFFWLGDTAWEMIHRLDRDQVVRYLDTRQKQHFNVIQTVILAEFDGLNTPNAYGHTPLIENDPMRPNVQSSDSNDFWKHVDFVVDHAAKRGMRVALLPTWGEWVTPRFAKPAIFQTPSQGYQYGRFLGDRYRDRTNIVWVLGGDRPGDEAPYGRSVWQAMAEGIADGTNGESRQDGNANWSTTLISYHSMTSSSKWFHQEPWIDFHMWGTYHSSKDWARSCIARESKYMIDYRQQRSYRPDSCDPSARVARLGSDSGFGIE